MGFLRLSLFMHYFVTLYFCNHFEEEETAGCFASIVLRMSCYCGCPMTLPHGAVGRSAVYDCGIY